MMKKIEAIIRPEKLEEIKDALLKAEINGITINQVHGCGKQYGWKEYHRGTEMMMNALPKIEIKLVVEDERLEEMIDLIIQIARVGEVGDGKIFVSDICEVIRIRTGERGIRAL